MRRSYSCWPAWLLVTLISNQIIYLSGHGTPGRSLKWLLPAPEPGPQTSGEIKSETCYFPVSELIPGSL